MLVEYVLIGGVNDTPEVAPALGNLLLKRTCVRVHVSGACCEADTVVSQWRRGLPVP